MMFGLVSGGRLDREGRPWLIRKEGCEEESFGILAGAHLGTQLKSRQTKIPLTRCRLTPHNETKSKQQGEKDIPVQRLFTTTIHRRRTAAQCQINRTP